MLQTATSETKLADPRVNAKVAERQSSLHPFYGASWSEGAIAGVCPHPLAAIHRAIGNHAVLRSLAPSRPALQTKLAINEPGDQYEQEADRVSEQVMGMPEPSVPMLAMSNAVPAVQRTCPCGGGCADCQKEQSEKGHEHLQMKPVGGAGLGQLGLRQTAAQPSVHSVLNSPGRPLDAATRSFMEPRFGRDFSLVRIHTGTRPAEAAREIEALAFTRGRHIVFGKGEYAPGFTTGRRLLAHELAHVVQQGAAPALARRAGPSSHAAQSEHGGMIARQKDPQNDTKPKPTATPCQPTLKSFEAKKTSDVRMAEVDKVCELLLGNPGKSHGMTFVSQLEVPAGCAGTLQYVQLTESCREIMNSKKEWVHLKTDGFWLDKHDPVEEKHIDSAGKVEFKTNDSPGHGEGGILIHADDRFKMFLLWKPDSLAGADRIPLAVADWNWSALAEMKPGPVQACEKHWEIKKSSASGGKGKPTKDLPSWKKVHPDDAKPEKGPC
jgi:hypothetical protein